MIDRTAITILMVVATLSLAAVAAGPKLQSKGLFSSDAEYR